MANCVFCKIASKEINSNIVHEDDRFIAVHDISPLAPIHVLIMPKEHYHSINDVTDESVLGGAYLLAAKLAKKLKIADSGYRLVVNTGRDGGQTVQHMHIHLLGGKALGGLC